MHRFADDLRSCCSNKELSTTSDEKEEDINPFIVVWSKLNKKRKEVKPLYIIFSSKGVPHSYYLYPVSRVFHVEMNVQFFNANPDPRNEDASLT